jgi:hypothetical protein
MDGLALGPPRGRTAHPTAQTPHDRPYGPAPAAPPPALDHGRELARQRTNHASVSGRCLGRRERGGTEQCSNEHHGEYALAGEHHCLTFHLVGLLDSYGEQHRASP